MHALQVALTDAASLGVQVGLEHKAKALVPGQPLNDHLPPIRGRRGAGCGGHAVGTGGERAPLYCASVGQTKGGEIKGGGASRDRHHPTYVVTLALTVQGTNNCTYVRM